MESGKMSTGAKVGIGIAVLVVAAAIVALVIWLLNMRKKDAERSGGGEEDEGGGGDSGGGGGDSGGGGGGGSSEPEPNPIEDPSLPDPMAPTSTPVKGKYYAVKSGDSDAKICQKAGYSSGMVYEARCAMRDHARNAWIPKTGSGTAKANNLFQGWAPMEGHADLPYAWKTPQLGWGGYKWPVIYVPQDSEVQA